MNSYMRRLWEEIPFPTSGTKKDMICWVVNIQQRTILRLEAALTAIVITFITYLVTGKLVWGFP